MPRDMGLGIIGDRSTCFRQQFRWTFSVGANRLSTGNSTGAPGYIGDATDNSKPILPPSKAARPNLELKEMEVRHVNETVFYPGRPEWKPLNITLYHIGPFNHDPIFDWIMTMYDPRPGVADQDVWKAPIEKSGSGQQLIQNRAILTMYDGCGEEVERWIYQHVWPQTVDWGMLDMTSSELVYIDVTLRYARAYLERN